MIRYIIVTDRYYSVFTDSALPWMVAETPLLWRSVYCMAFSYNDRAMQKNMYMHLCLQ